MELSKYLLQNSTQINYNQSCETLYADGRVALKSLTMFPNPVNNILNVHLSEENVGGSFTIRNAIGQQALATKILNRETQLNIFHLQEGLYFYIYSKNNFNESGKFVKD